jgi:diguanylate cyclase (GGDEF)-like protein
MSKIHFKFGLVINDVNADYYCELEHGVSDFCSSHNCSLYVYEMGKTDCSFDEYGYQKRAAASLINTKNLDGLIFLSSLQTDKTADEKKFRYVKCFSPLPVVSLGADIPEIPSIIVDNETGIRSIICHLIEKHGCRRFLLLGVNSVSGEAAGCMKAAEAIFKERKIPFSSSDIIWGNFSYVETLQKLEKIQDTRDSFCYDAIVSINDEMAFAALDFCHTHFISEDQVKITGFGDIKRCSFSTPTLTTVTQHIELQGKMAAETLYAVLEGREVPHLQVIPTEPYFRQSCGCIGRGDLLTNAVLENGERISSREAGRNYSTAEWYVKKSQLTKIIRYQDVLQVSVTLEKLRTRINKDVQIFDLSGFAVCLYKEPVVMENSECFSLPESAYIFSAFDKVSGKEITGADRNFEFNPHDRILPENVLDDRAGPLFVVALYHNKIQYGYILYRAGDLDMALYEILCMFVFTAVDSGYHHTLDEQERASLSEENRVLGSISQMDDMTGLLNRRGFMTVGKEAVEIAVRTKKYGSVVFCDMDDLKKINDTYGHHAGDEAIKGEGEVLCSVFRTNDIIGRIGGDEFAVIAPGLNPAMYGRMAEKIENACSLWNRKKHKQFSLSLSIGYVPVTDECMELSALLKAADAEQYKEKRRKKAGRM